MSALVSVVVPVYNGANFLAGAIDCVRKQHYESCDIIVIDDGSTDATPSVAAEIPNIRYVRQENAGPAAARNRGIAISDGVYVTFLDVDDLWPEAKLKTQVEFMQEHPEVDILLGRTQYVRLAHGRSEPFADPVVSYNLGAAMYRRAVFEQIGTFDPAMRYSEDVDWFMRAREKGAGLVLSDDVGLYYRRHDSNLTLDHDVSQANFAMALKKSLDRRRQAGLHGSLPDHQKVSAVAKGNA